LRKKYGKTSVRIAEECQLARRKQNIQKENRIYRKKQNIQKENRIYRKKTEYTERKQNIQISTPEQ
jgi:hypothetical protein